MGPTLTDCRASPDESRYPFAVKPPFKRFIVQLEHPICACPEQAIQWGIGFQGKLPALVMWCQTCDEKLIVENEFWDTRFELDIPYPGPSNLLKLSDLAAPPSSIGESP